ncbi:MAG TPA: 2-phospho-L-lactate guanylyltransferase [Candidatus Acidoferrales bacterium]|nr:2-phospho-L-lactate guanylyltransferase [Candidatus Acidoferrales bacterium]
MRTQPSKRVDAIIPVNVVKLAKARLSPVLKPDERAHLTLAMLNDVLGAVRGVRRIGRVTVVSADQNVRKIARSYISSFIWEGERRGLNKGVRLAILDSEEKGASAVVIIHADIPFANSRDLSRFLAKCEEYSVGLVPSRDGYGTNVLFLKPPGIIKPVFGRHSFQKHQSMCKRRNLKHEVFHSRNLGFDIDEPEDLKRLLRCRLRGETGRFLRDESRKHSVRSVSESRG